MTTKSVTSKSAATKKAAIKSSARPAPALAKKSPAKGSKKTTLIARIDVGWGNSVYVRGIGGGLSWDVGVLMDNSKKDEWTWACPASDGPITFKYVRNDNHWALGPDHIAVPGETSVTKPHFPPW